MALRSEIRDSHKPGDFVDSYELGLTMISNHAWQISSDECAQIAHKSLIGDISWLLAWQEPSE